MKTNAHLLYSMINAIWNEVLTSIDMVSDTYKEDCYNEMLYFQPFETYKFKDDKLNIEREKCGFGGMGELTYIEDCDGGILITPFNDEERLLTKDYEVSCFLEEFKDNLLGIIDNYLKEE